MLIGVSLPHTWTDKKMSEYSNNSATGTDLNSIEPVIDPRSAALSTGVEQTQPPQAEPGASGGVTDLLPKPYTGKKVQTAKRSITSSKKKSPYVRKRKPTIRKPPVESVTYPVIQGQEGARIVPRPNSMDVVAGVSANKSSVIGKSENPVGRPRTVARPAAGGNLLAKMVQSAKKTQSARKAAQTARLVQTARMLQAAIVSPASSHRSVTSQNSDSATKSNDLYKLSMHINIVSGFSKPVEHSVYREHTYSRPHNWIPEHMYMRPTRYLFSEKPISPSLQRKLDALSGDVEVDIERVDAEQKMPHCDAWNFAAPWRHEEQKEERATGSEDEEPSWEERISRDSWSAGQTRLFNSVASALDAIELRALVCVGSPAEFATMATCYDMHANDLRYQLVNCHYDPRLPVWLHALLLEHVPPTFRRHYTELLARLKKSIPHIVDSMIKVPAPHQATGRITAATASQTVSNVQLPVLDADPIADQLIREKFKRLPHSPVFLIIPDDHRMLHRKRFLLFTTMLSQMGHTFTVQLTQAPDGATVQQGLEHKMTEVRTKLSEIRSKLSNRDLVLVGFDTGAALASLLSLIEPVYAVVCLGFPAATIRGNRGLPDDAILNIRSPVLFFIGEHANTASVPLMDAMRGRMGVHTQLVVLGMCDDQLVMPRQRMLDVGVTQAMVDKSILVEIHTFLGQLLTNPVSMSIAPSKPKVAAQASQRRAKSNNNVADGSGTEAKPVKRYTKKQTATFPVQSKRKPARLSATQQLMISSAKYAAELPADYAAKMTDNAATAATAATAANVTPGLWQSKYKNPMLSPSPDRTRVPVIPTSSPQSVQRTLTFGPAAPSPPTPTSPHSVGATSVFVTPSVPGSGGAVTSLASAQTVKVISSSSTSRIVRRPAGGMPLIASPLPSGCYPIGARSDVSKLMTVLASRPGVTSIRPGVTSIRPGVTSIRPGVTSIRPGVTSIRPGITSIRPGSRPTKVVMLGNGSHKSPMLVPSTTIGSTFKPSQLVTVSSNSRRISLPYPVSSQPLTADNILNLPIIFAKDDDNIFQMSKEKPDDGYDASSFPSTSTVNFTQPGDAIDITPIRTPTEVPAKVAESRIVNKFEFSKPQPGVKYRKIFLTRLGQNVTANAPMKQNIKTITIQPNAIVDSVETTNYVRGVPRQLGPSRVARPLVSPRLLGPLKHIGPGRPRNPVPGRIQGTVRYSGPGRPIGKSSAKVTMIQEDDDVVIEEERGVKRKLSDSGSMEGLSPKRQCP